MTRFTSRRTLLLAAAVGSALAVAVPGAAHAATPLTSGGSIVNFDGPQTYSATTHRPYWSIVATTGSQASDADLALTDAAGAPLASSATANTNNKITEWVAVDGNSGRRAPGTYFAEVTGHPGVEPTGELTKHLVQYVDGRKALSTTTPNTKQAIGYPASQNWLVDVRDVYLPKGAAIRLTVDGSVSAVHLVGSVAGQPATYVRTRTGTLASVVIPEDAPATGVLTYTAKYAGWYGVVFESLHWSGAASARVLVATP